MGEGDDKGRGLEAREARWGCDETSDGAADKDFWRGGVAVII